MQPTDNRSSSVRPRASHVPLPRPLSALFTALGTFRILVLSCRDSFYRLENVCRVPTNSRVLFVLGVLSHVLDMCRIVLGACFPGYTPNGHSATQGGYEYDVLNGHIATQRGSTKHCGNETHCEHLGYKRDAYYPWTNVPMWELNPL